MADAEDPEVCGIIGSVAAEFKLWELPQTRASAADWLSSNSSLAREWKMSKLRESAADRLWRDKLDECCSFRDAAILLIAFALAGGVFLIL
jgi:hypothetical protein